MFRYTGHESEITLNIVTRPQFSGKSTPNTSHNKSQLPSHYTRGLKLFTYDSAESPFNRNPFSISPQMTVNLLTAHLLHASTLPNNSGRILYTMKRLPSRFFLPQGGPITCRTIPESHGRANGWRFC